MNDNQLDLSAATVAAFLADTIDEGDLASEARLACRLLATLQPTSRTRILEVGAGAALVTAFLHRQGADVLAIEPGGFGPAAAIRAQLVAPVEPIAADQLDPARHGRFDLIFSVNVLEHMRPLGPNLDGMASVLAPGGRMLHTCPNYRVPYEPHFRIPLVPVRPALTRHLARRAGRDPVWQTLNWITAGDVRRFARRHELDVRFWPGQALAALDRLADDPAFAERQRGLVRVLAHSGAARLLARLPPAWQTPITFTLFTP